MIRRGATVLAVALAVAGCAAHRRSVDAARHSPLARCESEPIIGGGTLFKCPGAVLAGLVVLAPAESEGKAMDRHLAMMRASLPGVTVTEADVDIGNGKQRGHHFFARNDFAVFTGDSLLVHAPSSTRIVFCGGSYAGVSPASCRDLFAELIVRPEAVDEPAEPPALAGQAILVPEKCRLITSVHDRGEIQCKGADLLWDVWDYDPEVGLNAVVFEFGKRFPGTQDAVVPCRIDGWDATCHRLTSPDRWTKVYAYVHIQDHGHFVACEWSSATPETLPAVCTNVLTLVPPKP